MKYLILECPNTRSAEYIFWSSVVKFPGHIICSGGNTHIVTELTNLESVLKANEDIYICFMTV